MAKAPGFTTKEREWLAGNGYGDMTKDVYEEIWVGHFATDKGAQVDVIVYKDKDQKTWAKMDMLYEDADGNIEVCYTSHGKTLQQSVEQALAGVKHYTGMDMGL